MIRFIRRANVNKLGILGRKTGLLFVNNSHRFQFPARAVTKTGRIGNSA
jgi:hypothetical protein